MARAENVDMRAWTILAFSMVLPASLWCGSVWQGNSPWSAFLSWCRVTTSVRAGPTIKEVFTAKKSLMAVSLQLALAGLFLWSGRRHSFEFAVNAAKVEGGDYERLSFLSAR
jgi:hypothetical protein